MLVSRRADTDHKDAVPISGVAVRRSLRVFRRFVLVGAIAFVAVPLAMLAVLDGTPFQFLPLALAIGGLIWLRIESLSLERDLRRARVQTLDAMDLERERIKRDLHDSAQQRLVSVRIHMGLLAQDADTPAERERMEELGRDLEAALSDIRDVTRDANPELLLRRGVAGSLESVAAHAPLPVTVESLGFGRYAPRIERGIYYCCLEGLQNAVKHAGPTATVRIRLVGEANHVSFSVEDSGIGFDPARVEAGLGLVSLADRVDVLGGNLTIHSYPGLGTRIHGEVPVAVSEVL
jgi:signal transduction histidine kinase